MSENTKNCPICPRHCDLTNPHCGRGAEYARTGQLPQENGQGHEHGHWHEHEQGHEHGQRHEHEQGHEHGQRHEHGQGHEHGQRHEHGQGHEHGQRHEHGQGHEHGQRHEHGHPHRLQFETREQQLVMKYLHHAVGAADRGGLTQEHAKDMFSVLTGEETLRLAELLEKLSDHWMALAPNKPAGHPAHHGQGAEQG